MGEGCCTQPYPCICKEAVSGFEPMTNKSPRHNFTAAPGLALPRMLLSKFMKNYMVTHDQEMKFVWTHDAKDPVSHLQILFSNLSMYITQKDA